MAKTKKKVTPTKEVLPDVSKDNSHELLYRCPVDNMLIHAYVDESYKTTCPQCKKNLTVNANGVSFKSPDSKHEFRSLKELGGEI